MCRKLKRSHNRVGKSTSIKTFLLYVANFGSVPGTIHDLPKKCQKLPKLETMNKPRSPLDVVKTAPHYPQKIFRGFLNDRVCLVFNLESITKITYPHPGTILRTTYNLLH